jgi:hypothetical protein
MVIAILAIYTGLSKKPRRLSKLAIIGFLLIISGVVFGDNRLIGYSLMGCGIILAVIDIFRKLKNNKSQK